MSTPHIIGWGHTPFGKLDEIDLEQLFRDAALPAIASAGLEPADLDGVFVGHFNGGFVRQDFSGSIAAVAIPELRHTPAVRLENACATGSAAIWAAIDALGSGRMKRALVVGFEKMNTLPNAQIGEVLLKCSYVREEGDTPGGFAGVFGQIAAQYFERYGDQSDALAEISAKNHRNGVDNPYAHMRRDLGFDFCRNASERNPAVAGPLKRSDCSLVSDGAAALVLSLEPVGGASVPAVRWRSRTQVNDFLPLSRRDPTRFEGRGASLGQGPSRCRGDAGRPGLRRDPRLLHDRGTARVRGDGTGRARAGRARHPRRRQPKGRAAAREPVGRTEVARPSDRRDRRVAARDGGDAARRPGRRDAARARGARRGVQHGWRRGGQLPQRPRGGLSRPGRAAGGVTPDAERNAGRPRRPGCRCTIRRYPTQGLRR